MCCPSVVAPSGSTVGAGVAAALALVPGVGVTAAAAFAHGLSHGLPAAFAAWSSFGHDCAGETSHPVAAVIKTNASPDADSLGLTISVITIVSLLANRLARPVVTPMPNAGTGSFSSATNRRVIKSASA